MTIPIVDTHVHLLDPGHIRYPWLAEAPAINRPYRKKEFGEASEGLGIEKIVFMEVDAHDDDGLKEVAWVTELAKEEPRLQGIVAFAPLERGEAVRQYLAELVKYPLVKGARRLIQAEGPGFCIQPDFIAGVKLLPEFGLSFDICIKHYQMGDVLKLVEQCSEVAFVLDHVGKPDIKGHLLDPWRAEITTLAGFPNVSCKISGMVTEADHQNWTRDDLKPYIDHVIQAFGPERVMFGGDWPVSTLATTYAGWLEALQWAVQDLPDADKHKLFHKNGSTFYSL
jgi:L-fuconolactonase